MNKLLCLLPMIAILTGCIAPVVDSNGQNVPVVIQTPTPAVIIDARTLEKTDPNTPVYVCKLKAFTTTFKHESIHRGQAKLNVQKQCLAKFNAMFCEEKDIECTEYK